MRRLASSMLAAALLAPAHAHSQPEPCARGEQDPRPALRAGAHVSPSDVPAAVAARAGGFVANGGQWPERVLYRVGRAGLVGWLERDGFTIARVAAEPARPGRGTGRGAPAPRPARGHAVRLAIEGARPDARVVAEEVLPGTYNWLLGAEPSAHVRGVRAFERVRYVDLLPGVDLLARGEAGPQGRALFAYDLLLRAGAALEDVSVRCEGADALSLSPAGELVIETPLGALRQRAPIAWTVDEAGRREGTRVHFRLLGPDRYGFGGAEDRGARALVVDPGFQWGSFLGEGDTDVGRAIALLPGGEPVVAGYTYSFGFPTSPGAFDPQLSGGADAFVTALTRAGDALVFSTFLGGGDDDLAYGVAVAPNGEILVGGETRSSDFPTPGGWSTTLSGGLDAFVARLDATGSTLLSATFLGGGGDERVRGLALTGAGDVVLCGSTTAGGFPVLPGSHQPGFGGGASDAFVSRFDAALGTLLATTFLGGNQAEVALSVAAHPDGSVLVGGQTFSTNFPVTFGAWSVGFAGASDGFVARLDPQHGALFSTYLGGSSADAVEAVAVGPQDEAVVAGWTDSADFPTVAAAQPAYGGFRDAFAARLDATGSQLLESTFLGGGDSDRAYAVAVDPAGRIALAGGTWSADFPTTPWAFDLTLGNPPDTFLGDAFVARLAGGALDYGTYLGGLQDEEAYGLVQDPQGQVFVTGQTTSFNFPIHHTAFDSSYDNSLIPDGFLVRMDFDRYPLEYGQGKITSQGGQVFVYFGGFPSLSAPQGGLVLYVDNAYPNSSGWLFHGPAAAQTPFMGGTLLVAPPFQRVATFPLDFFGGATVPVPILPSLVGHTRYFQFWFVDPGDPFGMGLSPAYEVTFYP